MKRKKRSGRKGAGLELAMIAMVAVFVLCSAAVTVAVLHTGQVNRAAQWVSDRAILDAMGEAYCAAEAQGLPWSPEDNRYRAQTVKDDGQMTLRLFRTGDDTCLLTVVLKKTGESYTVVRWTYG